jgi:uncharacterized damage-inducible protein DinB
MTALVEALLDRLNALHADIETSIQGLSDEAIDWVPGPEMNSICVTVVHVVGCERYWLGDIGRGDPSNRDRDAEFRAHGLSSAALQEHVRQADAYARETLEHLGPAELEVMRLSPRHGREFSVAWAVAHAIEHTAVHTGHIQIVSQLWRQRQAV